MAHEVHIGTSGWQYDHWRQVFYPRGLAKSKWFDFYAAHFATVELNNSFYRQPSTANWKRWHDAAPPGFRFAVKASRYISHFIRFTNAGPSLELFFAGAGLLGEHLGPVLFQARPDFARTPGNVERLDAFFALLPRSVASVIEFRDSSWYVEETFALLRRHGIALCCHDMQGSVSPIVATAPTAYIRLHGSTKRYASSYDESEIRQWAANIDTLSREADETWVYFNNDAHGYAVENARAFADVLGQPAPPAPVASH